MLSKPFVLLGLAVAALTAVAAAGHFRHCTRPGCLPGIPVREYQYRPRSKPVTALSSSPVLLEEVDTRSGTTSGLIRLYQWNAAELKIDQCSLSRVALQFYPDGRWTVSLRADQNPDAVNSIETVDGQTRFIGHIKRNEFVVKFRCYGDYRVPEAVAERAAGKPVLFPLEPPAFWVQKGQPYDYFFRGKDDEVRTFFNRVDRVELEFYYYQ